MTMTPRQLEAYEHLAAGDSLTHTADRMGITRTSVTKLLRKGRRLIGARNNNAAAAQLLAAGVITGEPPKRPIASRRNHSLEDS